MPRASLVRLSLCAVVVLTVGVGLISFPQPAAAADDTVTTELQPGLNLTGWTQSMASVEAIFDAIPELDLVYAWDAENQWFRWAARTETGVLGDLETLTPGMGLWLSITGREPVTWTRQFVEAAAVARLTEGWNLVIWGGEDNMTSEEALKDLEHILDTALDVDGRRPLKLSRGGAYWLDLAAPRRWDQLYRYPAFEFVSDYSPAKQREVRQHVDELVEFFYQRLGVRASGLTIRYGDPTLDACGEYRSATHTIFIADDGCFRALAHEYVHALQGQLSANSDLVPGWLVEGTAEYWADVYHDAFQPEDSPWQSEDYAWQFRLLARRVERLAFIPARQTYDVAHLAAHTLIKRVGEDRVLSYFRTLTEGRGFGWQDSFRSTFELEPAQFYLDFATQFSDVKFAVACPVAWYQAGEGAATPVQEECRTISGTITDLQGRPRSGILVDVVQPSNEHIYVATAAVVTGPEGNFSLVVPSGTYFVALKADFRATGYSTGGRSYFGGSTGFTNDLYQAQKIDVSRGNSAHIVISQSAVSGVVRGRNQEPLRGIKILLVRPNPNNPHTIGGTEVPYGWAGDQAWITEESGEFKKLVEPGTYKIAVVCSERLAFGTFAGWFGGERGLTPVVGEAAEIVVGSADVTGIAIDLPFTHAEVKGESCSPVGGQRAATDPSAPAIPGPSGAFNAAGWIEPLAGLSFPGPNLSSVQEEEQGQTQSPLEDEDEEGDADEDETYVPPRIEFVLDVTPEHKDEVRALVEDVVDFFHQRLGVRASGLTIRYGDLSIPVCGFYEPEAHTITIALPETCFHLIPHEYIHALQGQLRERTYLGPPWIVEGSADYWAAVYYDATGGEDYVTTFQSVVRHSRNIGFIPTSPDYSVGHMAVHYLAKRFGEEALTSYFRDPLEPARDGWNSSFAEAFGIGLNQFYVDFAQELRLISENIACPVAWYAPGRSDGDAPAEHCRRVEGTVTDLQGTPRSGVYVEVTTDRSGKYLTESSAFGATNDDGEFSLILPKGTYRVVSCTPGPSYSDSPCLGTTLHLPGYVMGQDVNLESRDRTDVGISLGMISGIMVGSNNEPVRDMRLELVTPVEGLYFPVVGAIIAEHERVYLYQKRTAGDGGFQWLVPRGVYRIVVLCTKGRFVGWYGGSSGLAGMQSESTAITIDTTDATDIVIRLPVTREEATSDRCVAAE